MSVFDQIQSNFFFKGTEPYKNDKQTCLAIWKLRAGQLGMCVCPCCSISSQICIGNLSSLLRGNQFSPTSTRGLRCVADKCEN